MTRRERLAHPLDDVPSIKLKLGFVIAAAVAVTVFVFWVGIKLGVWPSVSGVLAAARRDGDRVVPLARHDVAAARDGRGRVGDGEGQLRPPRARASSRDEVGELARAFNQMAAELAETDRVRRDLVANVSHELRTPITALQAVLENLVDGVDRARSRRRSRTMLAQVERLGRLVKQLLDLSRLESGAVPLDRTEFRGRAAARARGARAAAARARGRRCRCRSTRPTSPPTATPSACTRSSPTCSRTRCATRRAAGPSRCAPAAATDGVVIEVLDEGPGIPEAERGAGLRALLPRRHRARVERRRRRPRPRHRAVDRRPPRRRHPPRTTGAARLPHGRHPSRTRSARHEETPMALATIDDALKRIRRGEMVLVVDDEDRENEGDLTMAASWVTPEAVNFMLRWARGLVCMPCDAGASRRARLLADGPAGPRRVRHRVHRVDRPRHRGQRHRRRRPRHHDPHGARPRRARRATSSGPGHVFPLRARAGRRARAARPHRGGGRPRAARRPPAGRGDLRGARATTARPRGSRTSSGSPPSTASR